MNCHLLAGLASVTILACASTDEPDPRSPGLTRLSFVWELSSDTGSGATDSVRIATRLNALGIEARCSEVRPSRFVLETGAADPALIAAVSAPQRVSVRAVVWDQSIEPDPATVAREHLTTHPTHYADWQVAVWPSCSQALAHARRTRLPAATIALCTDDDWNRRADDDYAGSRLVLVQDPPAIDGSDIADAEVVDQGERGQYIHIRLTDAGRERFADVTAANIDKLIAIAKDEVVLTMPLVKSAITAGEFYLPGDAWEQARVVAAALKSGPLDGTWSARRR